MLGFEWVPIYDEFQLVHAVTYGLMVVSIALGNSSSFDDYTGGLYQGPCGTDIDHEMMPVGYGYNYWILRIRTEKAVGEMLLAAAAQLRQPQRQGDVRHPHGWSLLPRYGEPLTDRGGFYR